MPRMTFEEFVKSDLRNAWIHEPGIEIYVRRSLPSRDTDFDLANMNAVKLGGGALTRFLDKYEHKYNFYIENILNPRLLRFLKEREYEVVDVINVCMVKKKAK